MQVLKTNSVELVMFDFENASNTMPARFREAVLADLRALGLDGHGDSIKQEG